MDDDDGLRVIVYAGVSGSGKTSLAKRHAERFGWAFVEGDQYHTDAFRADPTRHPLTAADRRQWLGRLIEGVRQHLIETADASRVAVACSALTRELRDELDGALPDVMVLMIDIPREEAWRRVSSREDHFFSANRRLMDDQFGTLERPTEDETDVAVVDGMGDRDTVADRALEALRRRDRTIG